MIRRRWPTLLMTLAVLSILLAPGDRPVAAQPDLPAGLSYNRTVAPLDVEEGQQVHVTIDVQCEDCTRRSKGTDIMFVVDATPTMFSRTVSDPTLIDVTRDALQSFVNAMDMAKSQAGLISYANVHTIGRNLSDDRDPLLQAIDRIRMAQEDDVRGLQGAFKTAIEKIDNDGTPGNEKVVFVVVAGPDKQQALITMPTVTQAARNAGVTVVFLMFKTRTTTASYGHYVRAASECAWGYCTMWATGSGGTGERRYAWEVGASGNTGIGTVVRNVAEHFLFVPGIMSYEVHEGFDPAWGRFLRDTAVPLPSRSTGSPVRDAYWTANAPLPPTGLTIDYDVEMIFPEVALPVTGASELLLFLSDGTSVTLNLPNPDVNVRARSSVTPPTSTPSLTPTTPPPTTPPVTPATATPTPVTPVATTPTPGRSFVFLPALLDTWGF